MEFYTLHVAGLTRKLPLIQVGKSTKIASFSILGDVELTDALSDEITKKLKKVNFDYLVGPEVKVLPLIHGVAKRLGHKHFVICRKSAKQYMVAPKKLNPLPHFPKHSYPLVINGQDAQMIKNKKVVVLDDVISTGVTMRMITKLMNDLNAKIVLYVAALKQGEQFDELKNLVYLAELPIFKTTPPIDSTHQKA